VWEASGAKLPGSLPVLTVDMGTVRTINGFGYLPRHDGSKKGTIERFRFETSMDGTHWNVAIADGRFDNIRNNPDYQEMPFAAATARFFRLTPREVADHGRVVSAAEVTVLVPEGLR